MDKPQSRHNFDIAPQDKAVLALTNVDGVSIRKLMDGFKEDYGKGTLADLKLEPTFDSVSKLDNPGVKNALNSGALTPDKFAQSLKAVDAAQKTAWRDCIHVLSPINPDYPKEFLRDQNDLNEPLVYGRGNLKLFNDPNMITMIGTREPDPVARHMTESYVKELVKEKQGTVAGLAFGVDTDVAKETLAAGGKHLAWLSNGLDKPVYPSPNAGLANELANSDRGLVASTVPLNEKPVSKNTFVSRLIGRDKLQAVSGNGVLGVSSLKTGGSCHALKAGELLNRPIAVPDYDKITEMGKDPQRILEVRYQHLTEVPDLQKGLKASLPDGIIYDKNTDSNALKQRVLNESSLTNQYLKKPTTYPLVGPKDLKPFVEAAKQKYQQRQAAPWRESAHSNDFGLEF